jgi:hypothetical protein
MNTLPKLQRDLHAKENGGGDASGEQVREDYIPCGGCGATHPKDRCVNCFHPFEKPKERCPYELLTEEYFGIAIKRRQDHIATHPHTLVDFACFIHQKTAPAAPLGEDEIEKMAEIDPSGIKEFDDIIKAYKGHEIDFLTLVGSLWNGGYSAGISDLCEGMRSTK